MDIVVVVITVLGASLVFNLVTALIANWLGVRVTQFSIGRGPKLIAFRVGGTLFELRLLPIGSSVVLRDPSASEDEEVNPLARLPVFETGLLLLIPHLVIIIVGVALALASPMRETRLASLVALWTGVSGLLPVPAQNGYAFWQRLTRSPQDLPTETYTLNGLQSLCFLGWLTATIFVYGTLCFNAEEALALLDRVLPTFRPK